MSVLNRPMFMNRGGQMRHDERTIRNVDDEIYRIAPKTHGSGAGRIDAREEYARDLREKDYLRAQMNRMADGGVAEDGILARLKELDRGLKEDREIEQQARRDRGRKITDYIPFMESDGELWLENILYDGGRGIGSLFESSGEQEEEVRGPALLPETVTFLEETEILNDSTSTEERKAFARMQLEGLKDIPMLDEMLQQVDKIRATRRAAEQDAYHKMLQQVDKKRAAVPEMANGGDVAPMMAPPPMPMAPPPEAQVQMTEDAAAQQGEALGQEYLDEMMTGIDTADSTEELIDAMRGDDRTLQDRYDELANFVGERDASATPESVLTLVQPTIMMTEQGAMDSGIGELMQGIAGEVEMETEMGAPTPMGQGVGELMVSQSIEEVVPEMKRGGPVQYFQDGMEVVSPSMEQLLPYLNMLQNMEQRTAAADPAAISPRQQSLTDRMKGYEDLYADALGYKAEDEKLAQLQIWTDIANRGLALAGGVNPNTGERMTGNVLSQVAQAAQGVEKPFVQAGLQKRGAERSLRQAALGQAISDQTARETAQFAEDLRRSGMTPEFVQVNLSDGTQQLFNINDPAHAALLQNLQAGAYTTEDGTPLSMTGVPTKIGTPKTPDRRNVRDQSGEVVGEIDIDLPENEYTRQLAELADSLEVDVSTLTPDLTTFTTPALESARDQKLGTESVDTETAIRNKATAARRANRSIDQTRTILTEGNFQPGTAGETRAYISNLVDTFNLPIDTDTIFDGLLAGGEEAEAFQALSSQIVLDLESSLEGRVTDFRLRLIKEQVPTVSVTKAGNLLLMDLQEEINRGLIDEQKIARRFVDRPKGVLDTIVDGGQEKTFDQLRDEYYLANPIVTEDIIAKLNSNREVSEAQMGRLNSMLDNLPAGQNIFDYIQQNVEDADERRRLIALARRREGIRVDMDLLRQNFRPISVSESIDSSLELPDG